MTALHCAELPPAGLTEALEPLQKLLVELLAASLEHPDEPAHRYLASARTCARTLINLTRLTDQESLSCGRQHLPLRLVVALQWSPEAQRDLAGWRQLIATGQYLALVEQVAGLRFPQETRQRRPQGMRRLTRRLAERALRLKQTGVSWARLLSALIEELQAEPELDAESQLLLEQLQALQASAIPRDSGAYLRLTVARYQTAQNYVSMQSDTRFRKSSSE